MDIVIPKPVNEVLNLLYENNYEGYIVGGAVRNMVMQEKPKNYNIVTNAPISEVQKIFNKQYQTFLCGENKKSMGIVNAKFPMEISMYRTKSNTLEDHLMTTDFTMNALAYSDEDGLIDYSGGILDIRDKVIRVNNNDEELFIQDPLRILRAIRLSGEYGMKIDRQTQEYMFEHKDLLRDVAPERIRDELSKIMVTTHCAFYLKKYFEIFLVILPEFSLMEGFNQNDPHHIYSALDHTFVTIKNIEPNLELRLTMLFHDIAKPFTYSVDENGIGRFKDHNIRGAEMAREILNRLKFNKKTIQKVTKLIEYHDYEIPDKEPIMKAFLSRFGIEDIEDLFKVKKANFYGKNPAYVSEMTKIEEDYLRTKGAMRKSSFIKKNELRITGKDLVSLGVEQSMVGETLNRIYEQVLAGKVKNNHEKLISHVIDTELKSEDETVLKMVA